MLIREIPDCPDCLYLMPSDGAPLLIQSMRKKKQSTCDQNILDRFSNRILCCLRYYPTGQGKKLSKTSDEEIEAYIKTAAKKLEQGFIKLLQKLERFGFQQLTREESFNELYKLVKFSAPPKSYDESTRLDKQLLAKPISYCYDKDDGCIAINGAEYFSVIGITKFPQSINATPSQSLHRFNFPMILCQSVSLAPKEHFFDHPLFKSENARLLFCLDWIIGECLEGKRSESHKELSAYWNYSILVRAYDRTTMHERRLEIINTLEKAGFKYATDHLIVVPGFLSMLPGNDYYYPLKPVLQAPTAENYLNKYVPMLCGNQVHLRAICGPADNDRKIFALKDLIDCLVVNPMVWAVDLSGVYSALFEQLNKEMPDKTVIMRVSQNNSNFAFNPFHLADPYSNVSDEQFKLCKGLLKIMAGLDISSPKSEKILYESLKAFFDACGIMLRNRNSDKPIKPLSLFSEILENKFGRPELATAIRDWATGRRGAIFDSGGDASCLYHYWYFDLREIKDDAELTAIVYMIISIVHEGITNANWRETQKCLILDEGHRYITNPVLAPCFQRLLNVHGHLNITLDLTSQSINEQKDDVVWASTYLRQAFFFPGDKNIEGVFRKLNLTDDHTKQYHGLNSLENEVFYWSDGVCRILRL